MDGKTQKEERDEQNAAEWERFLAEQQESRPIRLHDTETGETTTHRTIAEAKKAYTKANGRNPGRWWKESVMGAKRPVYEKAEDRELWAVLWHRDDDAIIEDAFGLILEGGIPGE